MKERQPIMKRKLAADIGRLVQVFWAISFVADIYDLILCKCEASLKNIAAYVTT
jgi:hypothetical protein